MYSGNVFVFPKPLLSHLLSQHVDVIGAEDKRGCTVVITTTADGEVLPFQAIFGGKTEASLPKTPVRPQAEQAGHDFTVSESHWCTNQTLKRWVKKILYPAYIQRCQKLGLNAGKQECVLQYDLYKVHVAEEFVSWLKETYPFIRLNIIPAGCTSKVQIADVVLNRAFKARMKASFMEHASNEVMEQMRAGVASKDIVHDLTLCKLKPLIVGWLLVAFEHLQQLRPVVREAYERTGMLKAWCQDTQVSTTCTLHFNVIAIYIH